MLVTVKVHDEDRKMIYPARSAAVLRVLRKIVRGLAHHHGIGTAIPEDRVWVDVMKYSIPPDLLKAETFHHRDPEIFEYWFNETSEDGLSSLWFLKFYEKREFIATIASAS